MIIQSFVPDAIIALLSLLGTAQYTPYMVEWSMPSLVHLGQRIEPLSIILNLTVRDYILFSVHSRSHMV